MIAFFSNMGTTEWIIFGVIALLLFGRKLPSAARSLGASFNQFKKGLKDELPDMDVNEPSDVKKDALKDKS